MNVQSIPAVIIAGISLYVGLYHLLIYLRRRQHREDLTFALLCLATGCYDVFCAGLYNAGSVAEGAQWQRLQFIALAFLTTFFLWFVADYTRQKPGIVTYAFSAYYLLVIIVQSVDRSALTWLLDQPAIKTIALPFDYQVTYYEATLGPFTAVQGLVGLAASTYIVWRSIQYYRRGYRRETIPLLLALGCMYVTAFNDTLVSQRAYQFIYAIEYGYLAMILLMAYSLSSTVVEAAMAKESLRASEERFRSLVETTSDWVWETNANGVYTYASPRIRDLLGYEPEEILGKTPFDLMPPDELEHISPIFQDTWDNHRPFERLENAAQHKKGHLVVLETNGVPFFDANGKLDGYRGIDRDITQRKRAEEALAQRAAELRALYEGSLDINAQSDIDTLLRKVVEWVAPLTGIQISGLYLLRPDQTLELVVHHNLQDKYLGTRLRLGEGLAGHATQTGKPMLVEDYRQWDGRAIMFDEANIHRAVSVPLKTRNRIIGALTVIDSEQSGPFDDDQVRLLGLFADQVAIAIENAELFTAAQQELDERKRIQAELETKNAELERFTYTVSHDLKSPLITIGGFVGFLEKDALAGNIERVKADVGHINEALARMQRLLDELLELSRIGRLMHPPQETSFESIAREAIELARGRIELHNVQVHIAPDLPAVYGDRVRLVEVVQNLVDNACKFVGDQPHPRIEIGARHEQNETVFYVRDNGMGIEPQYHDTVFGLFNKLDPQSDGTGIGLALVKRIIETHGGEIWIESTGVGHGSTFCFTLPDIKPGMRQEA